MDTSMEKIEQNGDIKLSFFKNTVEKVKAKTNHKDFAITMAILLVSSNLLWLGSSSSLVNNILNSNTAFSEHQDSCISHKDNLIGSIQTINSLGLKDDPKAQAYLKNKRENVDLRCDIADKTLKYKLTNK